MAAWVAGRVRDCVLESPCILCVWYFWGDYALSPLM